jgi:hypothetical protein
VVQAPATPTPSTPPPATLPTNVAAPTISSNAAVSETLSTSPGTWSGTGPISYAYQWQQCAASCVSIAGATGSLFTLGAAQAGAKIQVVVTAGNAAGTAVATSAEVGPVAGAPGSTTTPTAPGIPPTVTVAKPTISRASLTGVPALKPTLRFTLAAGTSSPLITTISVSLPIGLSFARSPKALSRAIVIKIGTGNKLKLATAVHGATLTITLRTPIFKAAVAISRPAILVAKPLATRAKATKTKTVTVLVGATDTARATTRLALKLAV